jgi:GntR family transcriptional regulator
MVIDKGDGAQGRGSGASPASGGTGASPASGGLYSDQHLRVSDAEREAVCDRLAGHFAAGRLDQAEFDDRVARAMSAKTRADLRGLFADLSETGDPAGPELARGGGGTPGDGPPADGPRGPGSPIEFRLDAASGVPTYLQLVHQVEHALRLGYLTLGDQLPKVRDVVASLAINPNTVLKAYKELETKGLTTGRPGQGTFIRATLGQVALPELAGLHKSLLGWLTTADAAGLDEDGIVALFTSALRDFYKRRSGTGERRAARSGEAEGVA